jgi:hypothetical protein
VLAEFVEGHVMDHLEHFLGLLGPWITERLQERDADQAGRRRALEAEQANLQRLNHLREQRMTELIEVGISAVGMEVIERIDAEIILSTTSIRDLESQLEEWQGPPVVDDLLDYYSQVRDVIGGVINQAQGVQDINGGLHRVMSGVWIEMGEDRMRAELALKERLGKPGEFLHYAYPPQQRIPFDAEVLSKNWSSPNLASSEQGYSLM